MKCVTVKNFEGGGANLEVYLTKGKGKEKSFFYKNDNDIVNKGTY